MKPNLFLVFSIFTLFLYSCKRTFNEADIISEQRYKPGNNGVFKNEDPSSFNLVSSLNISGSGAAEISAYDPKTRKLFIVNNSDAVNQIDIVDISFPEQPRKVAVIDVQAYGGFVNSVDVSDGVLAAAIEANIKTNPGKVVLFRTTDYAEIKVINVGALPDMISFSPDGKFIVTANEGEPNSDYTIDPLGTVSIISVKNNYAVTTLDFISFAGRQAELQAKGLRIFGLNASFAQDIEPEHVAISEDSRIAWVTLQENNAIAKVDLLSKSIVDIFPLGFKNYNLTENGINPSDQDGNNLTLGPWPVYGIYQPDGIGVLTVKNIPYLFTANEGDSREYDALTELKRVNSLNLDPVIFPNAAILKSNSQLGRLNVTTTMGDFDRDNDYDALYSLGARSFSIWNGTSGAMLFDSKNELEQKVIQKGWYADSRSDDKGVEPEGIELGIVNKKNILFVGMERANSVAIYDVSNPLTPRFLQLIQTGDRPEGLLFISEKDSPNKRSILVVSSEGDGNINLYSPASF